MMEDERREMGEGKKGRRREKRDGGSKKEQGKEKREKGKGKRDMGYGKSVMRRGIVEERLKMGKGTWEEGDREL